MFYLNSACVLGGRHGCPACGACVFVDAARNGASRRQHKHETDCHKNGARPCQCTLLLTAPGQNGHVYAYMGTACSGKYTYDPRTQVLVSIHHMIQGHRSSHETLRPCDPGSAAEAGSPISGLMNAKNAGIYSFFKKSKTVT